MVYWSFSSGNSFPIELMRKTRFLLLTVLILSAAVGWILSRNSQRDYSLTPPPPPDVVEPKPTQSSATEEPNGGPDREVVADGLQIPWEILFLPDGKLLVSERPGRLLLIGTDRHAIEVSGVRHVGEGGLLGLAMHPDFERNGLLYLYLTSQENGQIVNRVERYLLDGASLSQREVILEGIRGASNHDGGRIAFGPDGFLYIGTGDAQQAQTAQDTNSLNGKILRIRDDGTIPADNPFGNAVYSYGHRNVQGLAWDDQGRLWATEHGRSGVLSGLDELNLIERGKNYGWPEIQGDEQREGMVRPQIHSGNETWAPSGAEYIGGTIFFAGLRGESLYEAKVEGGRVVAFSRQLQGEYGRLRSVRLGPDGYLYLLTSNRDGRGSPQNDDDRIIRIHPRILR
ncbi:MAG: hypothetical protein A2900_02320 [Candidatus Chisholmbacteria bacterium RIFCSPLOWO2_01_FULL_50_28]|uniref:Glucose/Sorbosone dehydrogenase domain-containing protein n=1 Tax=Candidatus Chisholmbacteria bacterium RIFCSPHIGHO2_01_FULL_52_32 TaxID=1797591 RepID=A0A1G1VTH3_9BACT|nr:MAG: hypothetical protein A2786_04425 [Candidatus Chisholmbacteria bacterium RIFCSPHIGHO2_01_FULL_52_32]OGY19919.1 MAG: hypothetical protein A2900_02320 [Candidatus Chisholmbacteria bacterium RIFCSPLOWO2_01_FULL_50_28]